MHIVYKEEMYIANIRLYGDLVYKFKKIVGRVDFSDQFRSVQKNYRSLQTYWI